MKTAIKALLEVETKALGVTDVSVTVGIPSFPEQGDYTTSVAMQLAKALKRKPIDIAQEIKERLETQKKQLESVGQHHSTDQSDQVGRKTRVTKNVLQDIERIEIAPPGFINFFLSASALSKQIPMVLKEKESFGTTKSAKGKALSVKEKKIMVEFAHPNTHKAFHIGHLRNITTGESIVRLLESQGNKVIRVNYQGDVGMHIAKALYGIMQVQSSKFKVQSSLEEFKQKTLHQKIDFLGKAYAVGSKAFEESEEAKREIGEINKHIYAKDPVIWDLYQTTRQWSLDYFDHIYKRVGTHFDRFYFESEMYEEGKRLVLEALQQGIFQKSDGAIIFPGEKFGLHNRVFITGEGNTTYEGKDVGLAKLQFAEYNPDLIVHVVGPEQAGYFQVLFKALEQVFPDTQGREKHLVYGWVKLKQGKMSSRTGNVVLGEWLLDEAKKEITTILQKSESKYTKEQQETIAEKAAVAAVKYSFLKVSTKQEIAFDLEESINFHGESGPYLQYTYARAQSVLRKASDIDVDTFKPIDSDNKDLVIEERHVLRQLLYFQDIASKAAKELNPSVVATYLFQLAQNFNLFYAKHSILGKKTENSEQQSESSMKFRLALTGATAQVIKNGLYLLGIEVLEQM